MSSKIWSEDNKFMQRAFELALRGMGNVSPNPMVGCVVVNNGQIIGEGWHERFGESHAEVNAIDSVGDSALLDGAVVYITLEPCSHHGKTPPCADLLSSLPLSRVVVAEKDPNPIVSGQGLNKIRQSNIALDLLNSQDFGRSINRRFFTFHERKRPYIILKWAQSKDGFIARENNDSKWISNEYSRKLVHKWRTEESAIMVGANTVQYDNPKLTARDWSGKNPVRLIVDPKAKLDISYTAFDGSVETIIYNYVKNSEGEAPKYVKIDENSFLEDLFADLWSRNILSVLVEGGSYLHSSLISADLWDESRVFIGNKLFEKGILAPKIEGSPENEETLFGDILLTYKN